MPPAKRFICIHGHFYQPPRENPWLETVETQDTAAPYHDWNERICAECYAPNGAARVVNVKRMPFAARASRVALSAAVSGSHMPSGGAPKLFS